MSPQSHLCRTWRRLINHDRFDIRYLPTCLIFCVLRFTHAFFEYGIDCITWYACSVYSDLTICVDAVLPNAATYHFYVQLLSGKYPYVRVLRTNSWSIWIEASLTSSNWHWTKRNAVTKLTLTGYELSRVFAGNFQNINQL